MNKSSEVKIAMIHVVRHGGRLNRIWDFRAMCQLFVYDL